jgi:hypothetical protein
MSNNIIFLNSNDFFVGEGSKGKVLCTNVKELIFVMFHADLNKCKYCEEAIPEFKQLPFVVFLFEFVQHDISTCMSVVPFVHLLQRVSMSIVYWDARCDA